MFDFIRDAVSKSSVLAASEASLNWGGSVVVREWAVASILSSDMQWSSASASQRSPCTVRRAKGTVLKFTTVQMANGLL